MEVLGEVCIFITESRAAAGACFVFCRAVGGWVWGGRTDQNVANVTFVPPPVSVGCSSVRRGFLEQAGFAPSFVRGAPEPRSPGQPVVVLFLRACPEPERGVQHIPPAEARLLRAAVSLVNRVRGVTLGFLGAFFFSGGGGALR